MRVPTTFGLIFIALLAPLAATADTVLGTWRESSNDGSRPSGTVIEIRRASDGTYEVVVEGKVNSGYTGTNASITRVSIGSIGYLRSEFPGVPDAVLQQLVGRAESRLTLTVEDGGRRLHEVYASGQIIWTGDRLDAYKPNDQISHTYYERIGQPPDAGALKLTSSGAGVFTCYIADGQRSGCLDVRNNAARRVRVYLEGAPGVLCTVDPGVYCSVPVPFGEHAIRVEPDDEQGIGPPMSSRITMGASGVRLAVEGSTN